MCERQGTAYPLPGPQDAWPEETIAASSMVLHFHSFAPLHLLATSAWFLSEPAQGPPLRKPQRSDSARISPVLRTVLCRRSLANAG